MNDYQNQYVTIQNTAINTKPIKRTKPPKSKCRRRIYKIVQAAWFDLLIMVIIGLNTAVTAMTYHRMSDSYALFIEVMNYIFVFLYNVEFVLKIIGLGKQYFTRDSWNLFDFVCICLSDFAILLIIIGVAGPIKNIVIFLRAFRLVRLLRFISSLFKNSIMSTLVGSIPQIQDILALLSIIMFMYAVLGISLFSPVMYRDFYNDQNNFRNIFNSLVLLLRCMTGEDWNGIMHDLASDNLYEGQECIDNQTYDDMQRDGIRGCGTWYSYPYFISFFIINAIIILDLSIGVFINVLSEARKDYESVLSQEKLQTFLRIWSEYDPDSTGWITPEQLLFVIFELPAPLGWGKITPRIKSEVEFESIYHKQIQENILLAECKADGNN